MSSENIFLRLLPITLAVFVSFLTIGLPLPVLPLHVHDTLGMSALIVGIVVGSQFAAALVSRAWAGNLADLQGAKRAVITGCIIATLSGGVYLVSLVFVDRPDLSVGLLLLGRLLLGCGESLIATGSLGWGIGLVGPQNAGKVMVWVGIAMYAAYGLGAPAGVALYAGHRFGAIALATTLTPLLALSIIAALRPIAPAATRRVPFYKVLGAVWLPGLGLAFCSIGFGGMTAFIALLFAQRAWGDASLAFTAFGGAFIGARLLFGHLPDRLGGARVALVCVLTEAVGQFLIWGAEQTPLAYAGAALTGFGYSLAFPGFGVEAVRRAPPQSRALAMGAYVAFLDVALGVGGPATGLIANRFGVDAVFLVGAAVVACAMIIAARLVAVPPKPA